MLKPNSSSFCGFLRFVLSQSRECVDTQSCNGRKDAVSHARHLADTYGDTVEIVTPDGETLAEVQEHGS